MLEPKFHSRFTKLFLRIVLLFGIFQLLQTISEASFIQRFSGFSLIRFDSEDSRWRRFESDVNLPARAWIRTSKEFSGRLIINGGAPIPLDPASDYVVDEKGLKVERKGIWYVLETTPQVTASPVTISGQAPWWTLNPYVEAKISRENEFRGKIIRNSFALKPGDRIVLPLETGAYLSLEDGSEIRIQKGSILRITQERIDLLKGSLFCSIPSEKSRLEIVTAQVRVSVRGSVFEASYDRDSEVRVFDGVLKIASIGETRGSRFLQRGQGALVREGIGHLELGDINVDEIPRYGLLPPPGSENESDGFQQVQESRSQRIQRLVENARSKGFEDLAPAPGASVRQLPRGSLSGDLARTPDSGDDASFTTLTGQQGSSGMQKEFESWHDSARDDGTSNPQRIQTDSGYEYQRNKQEKDWREERAVGVRADVRREAFEKGQIFRSNQEEGSFLRQRELGLLKSFVSRQQLELERVKRDISRNTRERDRGSQRIELLENKLKQDPNDNRIRDELDALREQKQELDREAQFLKGRSDGLALSIQQSLDKIRSLTDANARGSVIDQNFHKKSRELLRP